MDEMTPPDTILENPVDKRNSSTASRSSRPGEARFDEGMPRTPRGRTGHRARILIVDDESSARETLQALLHLDPYELQVARGGIEAIQRLNSAPVDLVLCDVMMPGIDGFEVCRQIKAHQDWRFVPVILVTALDGQDDMVRGIEAGADDFLSKPIDKVLLRARIRAMMRLRQMFHELRGDQLDADTLLTERRERIIARAALSSREREVLDLLLLGRTHEEIGLVLGISARTAKFHQTNVLQKLGADSRTDLIRIFL
jgi:DNA-binding NarL/FixJ family response regulator